MGASWHLPGELRFKPLLLAFFAFSAFDIAIYWGVVHVFAEHSKTTSKQIEVDQGLTNLGQRIATVEQRLTTLGADVTASNTMAVKAERHAAVVKGPGVSRTEFEQLKCELRRLCQKADPTDGPCHEP
jgi:hypothetical protein